MTFGPDSGTFGPDSGTFRLDSGTFAPDSGTFAPDSGTFAPDSGIFRPDSGIFRPDSGTFRRRRMLPTISKEDSMAAHWKLFFEQSSHLDSKKPNQPPDKRFLRFRQSPQTV